MEHLSYWKYRLRDASGIVVAESPEFVPNILAREGEQLLLGNFFRNDPLAAPTYFEIGLCDSSPTILTTAASLTGEPSAAQYNRQRLNRDSVSWPTLAIPTSTPNGPYKIYTAIVSFHAAGGDITPFTSAFIVARVQLGSDPTVLTPFLISAAATTQTSIPNGNTLDVTIAISIQTPS